MNRSISCILVLLLLSGCAHQQGYQGDKRTSDEISVISPSSVFQLKGHPPLIIEEVDGVRLNRLNSGAFEVLPGKHTIKVFSAHSSGGFSRTQLVEMTFGTEAGKKYIVDYKIVDRQKNLWKYFVVEEKSRKLLFETENRTTPIDLIPMYGYPDLAKTDQQKQADEKFIIAVVAESGSREISSKEFAAAAWNENKRGNAPNAMQRFNQAWLLNPNYYQPYWGFGALLLAEGKPSVAISHFEKALTLIDDEKEKPRLLTDTAKAYTLLGSDDTRTTDKAEPEKFFSKANALFEEALKLDPRYGNAYRAWALSLYNEGDYEKAWTMVKKLRGLGGPDFDPKFIDALSRETPEPM